MISRRDMMTATGALLAGATLARPSPAWARPRSFDALDAQWAAIEAKSQGRLGIAVLDTATGARSGHRADERFPMCSTFKLLAAGAVLQKVDAGRESLERRIRFETRDLVVNSPVTGPRVGGEGMTLSELCQAALNWSDNTAGNILLASLGGPAGLTAFARSLGDPVTRLDRIETDLNEALPGDPRDTTTPAAMLADIQKLVLGDALSPGSRKLLERWLLANKTADKRLRARLPAGWRLGDKTGSGERGSTNDVGLVWPPGRAPLLVCIYLTGTTAGPQDRDATLASVGQAIAGAIA